LRLLDCQIKSCQGQDSRKTLTISGLSKNNYALFKRNEFFFAVNNDYLIRDCTFDEDCDDDQRIYIDGGDGHNGLVALK
jgi:hypothetical protein